MDDDRFSQKASIINLSIRGMMCTPLLVGDELLGLIQVETNDSQQQFMPEDLQVLTGLSSQVAIAVKNAQLNEDIEVETAKRTSLQRYFSPKFVDMLMSGDVTTALGGDNYRGTILFADIIDFTTMSEAMAPADVLAKLNRYLTIIQKLIYENDGNVDKVNGDGIMAFWGVPHPDASDEANAVYTALQMQRHLWSFNLDLQAENQAPIHMGIGLNTGDFVAGNIGSEDKIEFTLIGTSTWLRGLSTSQDAIRYLSLRRPGSLLNIWSAQSNFHHSWSKVNRPRLRYIQYVAWKVTIKAAISWPSPAIFSMNTVVTWVEASSRIARLSTMGSVCA